MSVDSMYQEIILDHYKNPHHRGLREPYDAEVRHLNPTCGDEITLRVQLDGDQVVDVSYDNEGCSISQAAASVMTDLVIGKDVETATAAYDEFLALMQSKGQTEPDEEVLEDAIAFAGVSKYPARVKCALLPWMAWRDAVAQAGGEVGRINGMTETTAPKVDDIIEAMKDVVDPELGINVVDLGLVYGVTVDGDNKAVIDMTLTSAACPLTDVIEDQTASALDGISEGYAINWVWMPPWGPDKITDDGREQLRALGFNV